ncbi:hypothetical protein [Larkinella rosea]|uniref:Cytochrome B n=1 Tax=Larkinella rosea TaxID=2025312 RepID=A0A3P1C244_9BACT|nr:hypothetical protein [Larkinella rosea]RRB07377.1 hypothetical protein EHT25_06250 [Larkinella rosea]
MYPILLTVHSVFRWVVLVSLCYSIYLGITGWSRKKTFNKSADFIRHATATIAHIQLMIGYILYFNSPIVAYFRAHFKEAIRQFDFLFFGLIHILLMTIAIVFITIGSAVAKRKESDNEKFKTMTIWFSLALLLILLAIPWPFSPLANRPYFRAFHE